MAGKKGMKATGRPKVDDPRVNITIRVSQETAAKLHTLRECGFKVGRWMDTEIEKFFHSTTTQEFVKVPGEIVKDIHGQLHAKSVQIDSNIFKFGDRVEVSITKE